ncbi:autotransporter-associated beta strand repeat-containing protein, partial [Novosphingobium sp. Chol11]|uniref:autotransporter-associated beta strand repeat-containing protein n=1 Tax=Novosphingobium sp. Chol11 TaxID=1385763 RepID=UPI0025CDFD8D
MPNGNTAVASFTNVTSASSGGRIIDLGGGAFTVKQLNMVSTSTVSYGLTNGTLILAASSGSAGISVAAATTGAFGSGLLVSLTLNLASNTNFDIGVDAALGAFFTMTGVGALNKTGAGTLALARDNSAWTGATNLSAGTILLKDINALASSSALTVSAGGTLVLDAFAGGAFNVNALSGGGAVLGGSAGVQTLAIKGGGGVFSGAITDGFGTVALRHDSTGSTYLSGNGNTYTGGTTVNAGILHYGDGGTSNASVGTGTVTINGGTFALFRPGDYTFANALAGAGRFDKNSAGTATLTGDSSLFTGQITVAGGTLKVNDSAVLGNKAPIEVKAG